jgi:hypothetical protein
MTSWFKVQERNKNLVAIAITVCVTSSCNNSLPGSVPHTFRLDPRWTNNDIAASFEHAICAELECAPQWRREVVLFVQPKQIVLSIGRNSQLLGHSWQSVLGHNMPRIDCSISRPLQSSGALNCYDHRPFRHTIKVNVTTNNLSKARSIFLFSDGGI